MAVARERRTGSLCALVALMLLRSPLFIAAPGLLRMFEGNEHMLPHCHLSQCALTSATVEAFVRKTLLLRRNTVALFPIYCGWLITQRKRKRE